CLIWHNSAYTF
nr:immunoglobulin light chain junction region [Macaca mulatta]